MQKPEVNFYPVIDLFDVERYLSDVYDEEVDLLITLFGNDVSNDICKEWLVEPPEEIYSPECDYSAEDWLAYNRFNKYIWENFRIFKYVIVRICW